MANYLPFNSILDESGKPDRAVKAEDWAWYFSTFISNGVFPEPSDGLQVLATGGMGIGVQPGYGYITGHAFKNSDVWEATIETADGVLGRIDRIVLRLDMSDRVMELAVLKGTPSASPVAPALTRAADRWELALADVSVTAGLTTVTQANITDRRYNTDLCGIVVCPVDHIDATTLTAQFTEFFDQYSAQVLVDYDNYVAALDTFESDFENDASDWMAAQSAAFNEWFNSTREQLDEDVAGHLQNEIDDLSPIIGVPDAHSEMRQYAEGEYCVKDNIIYRAKSDVIGSFSTDYWEATDVLSEIEKAIARAKDKVYDEMAKGSLTIDSGLVVDDVGSHLLVDNSGNTLGVSQTIIFQFRGGGVKI